MSILVFLGISIHTLIFFAIFLLITLSFSSVWGWVLFLYYLFWCIVNYMVLYIFFSMCVSSDLLYFFCTVVNCQSFILLPLTIPYPSCFFFLSYHIFFTYLFFLLYIFPHFYPYFPYSFHIKTIIHILLTFSSSSPTSLYSSSIPHLLVLYSCVLPPPICLLCSSSFFFPRS